MKQQLIETMCCCILGKAIWDKYTTFNILDYTDMDYMDQDVEMEED